MISFIADRFGLLVSSLAPTFCDFEYSEYHTVHTQPTAPCTLNIEVLTGGGSGNF